MFYSDGSKLPRSLSAALNSSTSNPKSVPDATTSPSPDSVFFLRATWDELGTDSIAHMPVFAQTLGLFK